MFCSQLTIPRGRTSRLHSRTRAIVCHQYVTHRGIKLHTHTLAHPARAAFPVKEYQACLHELAGLGVSIGQLAYIPPLLAEAYQPGALQNP